MISEYCDLVIKYLPKPAVPTAGVGVGPGLLGVNENIESAERWLRKEKLKRLVQEEEGESDDEEFCRQFLGLLSEEEPQGYPDEERKQA